MKMQGSRLLWKSCFRFIFLDPQLSLKRRIGRRWRNLPNRIAILRHENDEGRVATGNE